MDTPFHTALIAVTITVQKRANCWTARFRGHPDFPTQECPLPFAPTAPFDLVACEVNKRFPEARVLAVVDGCEGCGQ